MKKNILTSPFNNSQPVRVGDQKLNNLNSSNKTLPNTYFSNTELNNIELYRKEHHNIDPSMIKQKKIIRPSIDNTKIIERSKSYNIPSHSYSHRTQLNNYQNALKPSFGNSYQGRVVSKREVSNEINNKSPVINQQTPNFMK